MSTDNEQKVTRKLRAILSADVKGYSLLMADDEAHTIRTLKVYRKIMSDLIRHYSGRVVDNPGDNVLAEFSSAVDAVNCAAEIQKKLEKENNLFVADKRLRFRIGVNIGDVIQDGDRIYGSGVNVASRIEGLTKVVGRTVLLSAATRNALLTDVELDELPAQTIKGKAEAVTVFSPSALGCERS